MKLARLFGLAVLLIGAFSLIFAQVEAEKPQPIKYVEVKKPFQNVYTKLDPKSDIIRQVKKGEYLELLSQGESWYKVKVDGKDGFLEAKAGKVVNKKGAPIVMFLLFIVVLLGGAGGVILYIKKQNVPASSHSIDDDDD
jgi:hypothetical protein